MSPLDPPLPEPTAPAQAHSAALSQRIAEAIDATGGWIGFDRYMDMALYEPGLGYYAAGARKLGATGDFVTAPEVSSLFGATLARQAAEILRHTPGAEILELGAGSGRLAADLLVALDGLGCAPEQYSILEVSADLRARQQDRLGRLPPRLASRVRWLDRLPAQFAGVIIGNEVLDALPVRLVAWHGEMAVERGVILRAGGFALEDRPIADPRLLEAASRLDPPRPYVSEIALVGPALVRSIASMLVHGVVLLIDYGFGATEYYHPQRSAGTLMCHYRHRAHGDPFFWPGLQDITAHVDFSAVLRAGLEGGLSLLGYTSQAHFLVNLGVTDLLAATPTEPAAEYLRLAAGAQKLLSPSEMGELFKVIALGRGMDMPLSGFVRGDLSRLL